MTKNELVKFLKNNEFDIQNANASYTAAFLVFLAYANSSIIKGIEYGPICSFFNFKNPNPFYQIIKKSSIEGITKKIYKLYLNDKNSLEKLVKRHLKLTSEFDKLWHQYTNFENKDKKYLFEIFNLFRGLLEEWWYYGAMLEDKGEVVNREIVPKYAEKYNLDIDESKEIILTLAHPKEKAVFNQERELFLEICVYINNNFTRYNKNKILSDNSFKKLADRYKQNFYWFKTDFYNAKIITDKVLLDDVLKEIRATGIKQIEDELLKIKKTFKNLHSKKKKLLKSVRLDKEDKDDLIFAEKIFYWFDMRKLGMMKHLYYLFLLMQDIAEVFDMKYAELSLYSLEEIDDLFQKNKKLPKDTINIRNKSIFTVYEKGNKVSFFYGKVADEMLNLALKLDKSRIQGIVASKTKEKKILGKVRIINDPSKEKFKKGEILVTSMTRIEYVPYMRIAKAIITNEGGMACHAAIVSRELGTPAIIGTKNATKVLKNGQKVEMNLENGEIKVIK